MSVLADNKNLVPIPVVASFNSKGEIIPIYFSVEGIRLKVDNIVSRQELPDGVFFQCEVTNYDYVQTIKLYLHRSDFIWSLEKQ